MKNMREELRDWLRESATEHPAAAAAALLQHKASVAARKQEDGDERRNIATKRLEGVNVSLRELLVVSFVAAVAAAAAAAEESSDQLAREANIM